MTLLTEKQQHTLTLVCNTLIPSLEILPDPDKFYERCATDLAIPVRLLNLLKRIADEQDITELRLFLDSLEIPLVNTLLTSRLTAHWKPFSGMNLEERTDVLLSWSQSRIPVRRKLFRLLKRLTLFLYYSVLNNKRQNPNLRAMEYQIPANIAPLEKLLQPLVVSKETVLHADVVIVGSEAGGSVAAAKLAENGQEVIVVEKGAYLAASDFDSGENAGMRHLYEKEGLFFTRDGSLNILAGSNLGGGTTIGWSVATRPPDHVLKDWGYEYGLQELFEADFQTALETISRRINVNQDESYTNLQNTKLERGAQVLFHESEILPRHVRSCESCGFCVFGCQYGAKQSASRTFLRDATQHGAQILTRTTIERVLIQNGKAVGVEGFYITSGGQRYDVTIHARRVIVAAGAIHTPALLWRSGLTHQHIGRNLSLHPTTFIPGLYHESIRGWEGVMCSRSVTQFTSMDGMGYGVRLETVPVHPGMMALWLPWHDGKNHKATMLQLEHLAAITVMTRDRGKGYISVNRRGESRVHYRLSKDSSILMKKGMIEAVRIHDAAGAREIITPFNQPHIYRQDSDTAFLEKYIHALELHPMNPGTVTLFSNHQMSTCRMADSPLHGVVMPTGETYEVDNLYIADASILPSAPGVSPMLTIMAMAHLISSQIKVK